MAGTSVREQILGQLEATLLAITTGAGFNFTVKKVDRKRNAPQRETSFPVIYLHEPTETKEQRPIGAYTVAMNVTLECYVFDHLNSMAKMDISGFLSDVETAVLADPTVNSLAIDLAVIGNRALNTANERTHGLLIDLLVDYRHAIDDPTDPVPNLGV